MNSNNRSINGLYDFIELAKMSGESPKRIQMLQDELEFIWGIKYYVFLKAQAMRLFLKEANKETNSNTDIDLLTTKMLEACEFQQELASRPHLLRLILQLYAQNILPNIANVIESNYFSRISTVEKIPLENIVNFMLMYNAFHTTLLELAEAKNANISSAV